MAEWLHSCETDTHLFIYSFINFEDKIVTLWFDTTGGKPSEDIIQEMFLIKCGQVCQQSGYSIYAGVSGYCTENLSIAAAYEQAQCAVYQRLLNQNKFIFFYDKLEDNDQSYYNVSFKYDFISNCIQVNKQSEIALEINRVFSHFDQKTILDIKYVENFTAEYLYNLSKWSAQFGINSESLFRDSEALWREAFELMPIREKAAALTEITQHLAKSIGATSEKKENVIAYEIIAIIDAEYFSNYISLEYLSERLRKSPAYISKVFKNEFNCNLSDYVTNKRMTRAKELLTDFSLKVYEIAQQLGYADTSNFIKVFKKKNGISPNEYRALLRRRHGKESEAEQ